MTKIKKIGIIGDMHMRQKLGYAEYIADGRIAEKEEILDFIVSSFSDCDKIVFLGDQFDKRSNPSNVIREFTNFLERFSGKTIYMISGNHSKYGSGETALDYLKEIKNPNWNIVTRKPEMIDGMIFCPYLTNAELEVKDNEEALEKILKLIKGAKTESGKKGILFHHNCVSDTLVGSGRSVNDFPEPIFSAKLLKKEFELVVGGHVHRPQIKDNIVVSGSIFNQTVGEVGKCIFKIEEETLKVETIDLPGRKIYKREDPTDEDLEKLEKNSIVKVIITKKIPSVEVSKLKDKLKRFDAYIFLEQIPRVKKKLHYGSGEGLLELSVEHLLELYSKDKKIDKKKIIKGFDLIKD